MKRYIVYLIGFLVVGQAQAFDAAQTQQAQRTAQANLPQGQKRVQEQESRLQPDVNKHLKVSVGAQKVFPIADNPCFKINKIELNDARFDFVLQQTKDQLKVVPGMCLGVRSIRVLAHNLQNNLIGAGYITSRIQLPSQNLTGRVLRLDVIPGRVEELDVEDVYTTTGRVQRHSYDHLAAVPIARGDVLNIREIEQAYENMQRLSTVDTKIQVIPGQAFATSRLLFKRQHNFPVIAMLSVDNSGNRGTGLYQGIVGVTVDNPLGINDILSVSYFRDVGGQNYAKPPTGDRAYSVQYSFPYHNWLFGASASQYGYHQVIPSVNADYDYHGVTRQREIVLSRLVYRNSHRKISANMQLWYKDASGFIDDAEIPIQRRRTNGMTIGMKDREFFPHSLLDVSLFLKRGLGWFNALPAPEEQSGQGTSRMTVVGMDVKYYHPFTVKNASLSYRLQLKSQYAFTRLTPSDRFVIGDYYSVRGFSGDLVLGGEHGVLLKNTLALSYARTHQIYVGLDYGAVFGPSSHEALGHTLVGAVLGLRGQFNLISNLNWQYNIAVGRPIYKPKGFKTSKNAITFSTSIAF